MAENPMITKCGCGAEVQATQVINVYWSFKEGQWVAVDKETVDVRYYCENDHEFRFHDKRGAVVLVDNKGRPLGIPMIKKEEL